VTGDDVVYAYPDYTTLLAGKFLKGVMVEARRTTLAGVKFDKVSISLIRLGRNFRIHIHMYIIHIS
jgi:hypothetical protein